MLRVGEPVKPLELMSWQKAALLRESPLLRLAKES